MPPKKPTGSLEEAEVKLQSFEKEINDVIGDRKAEDAPDTESQTKMSSREMNKRKDIYLEPIRTIRGRDKPNPKFEKQLKFGMEKVRFIAENKEIIGEEIDLWTKPFAGVPAQEWKVPVNTPVWGPRHLADQIKRKYYHRLMMKEQDVTSHDGMGTYTGRMVSDTTVARLDAHPAPEETTRVVGKSSF